MSRILSVGKSSTAQCVASGSIPGALCGYQAVLLLSVPTSLASAGQVGSLVT